MHRPLARLDPLPQNPAPARTSVSFLMCGPLLLSSPQADPSGGRPYHICRQPSFILYLLFLRFCLFVSPA